ncbi:hypothetical protein BHM03_00031371 [Ensete ventricosum]|nr:hypothetical protein BHM03_00031371 [Ensete ventricosum]
MQSLASADRYYPLLIFLHHHSFFSVASPPSIATGISSLSPSRPLVSTASFSAASSLPPPPSLYDGMFLHISPYGTREWTGTGPVPKLKVLLCLQEAQKRMKIKKPPHILVIHLKRFKYIEQLGRYKKLSYRVVFPMELKLTNTVEDAESEYSLFAVVVHVGSEGKTLTRLEIPLSHLSRLQRSTRHGAASPSKKLSPFSSPPLPSSPLKMDGSGGRNRGQELSLPLGACGGGCDPGGAPLASHDPFLPLLNLSALGQKMDSLRRFLFDAIDSRTVIGDDQLQMVSSHIASAVQGIILNGAALLASSQPLNPSSSFAAAGGPTSQDSVTPRFAETRSDCPPSIQFENGSEPPTSDPATVIGEDDDIVEIDAAELLAEHVHLCEICGKGFKRDANLRMHMRAHGDRFKTLEALSKPDREVRLSDGGEAVPRRSVRFSCPYPGCNRNRAHKKFRPLKSVACVKNHFKRSHCPKMYSCHRCNKKNFSVVADLRSHLKHCGVPRWRCSCGTSFSRKDKLFGHITLFEGHMPAVEVGAEEEVKKKGVILEADEEEDEGVGGTEQDIEGFDSEFLKGIMEDFDDIERRSGRMR